MKKILLLALILTFPLLSFAQDSPKKKAYFFYLDSCPHCHNVNDYFNANGIYDKYDIKKLDASAGQNGQLLMKLYEANNYPENQRGGVPVVAFGDKFLVGDKPVIDGFVNQIEVSESALQLPNPAGVDVSGLVVHDGPIDSSSASPTAQAGQSAQKPASVAGGEKKKNWIPLIIGALVIVGAGTLLFLNREK
jgi:hypothetical protein